MKNLVKSDIIKNNIEIEIKRIIILIPHTNISYFLLFIILLI